MLMPKRVKHRKQFRGSLAGKAMKANKVSQGEWALVSTDPCWIKSNQIEAARVALTRYIKYSSVSSRTSPYPLSRPALVWVKVKAP